MKRTLILLILFAALATRAEVIVERVTRTSRYTGQETERTINWRDIIVRDLDGPDGASIQTTVIRGRKLYTVSRFGSGSTVFRANVRGVNGHVYTVVTDGRTETNDTQVLQVGGLLARGLNTTLAITPEREISYPRVFRGSSHLVELNNGEYRAVESTYTRMYSQTETREANTRGNDVEAALTRLVQKLQDGGYVPLQ